MVPTLPGDGGPVAADIVMQTPTPTRPMRALLPAGEVADQEGATRAPPLTSNFDALDFPTNTSANGFVITPPDPHGAVGPNHLLSAVNLSIRWSSKSNTAITTKRLGRDSANNLSGAFFDLPGTANDPQVSAIGLFDPRVLYDQYANRFIVICAENTDTFFAGDPPNSSYLFIGVSQTSDPNGAWNFQRVNAIQTIAGSACWLDFPALSVDDEAIYITGNYFLFGEFPLYQGGRLFVLPKGIGSGGVYDAGGASAVAIYNPAGLTGQSNATMAPAHMFGAVPGALGTFLVRYDGASDGLNESLSVIRIDNPLGAATFTHQFVPLGNIDAGTTTTLPSIPQAETEETIAPGDRRVLHAVWRNNQLYAVFHVRPPSGVDVAQCTAHWARVETGAGPAFTLTLAEQGNIGGEDISPATRTFYPAIAVDAAGNIGFGFSASSETIFVGAYYTARAATDAPGTVQATGVLQAGLAPYVRNLGGGNRWGDYTGAAVDPANGSLWILGQYAMTQGQPAGGDGRWATRWGNFTFPDAVAPTILGVYFDSTAWTAEFRAAAGNLALGFPASTGSSQFASMPWTTIDRIHVQFNEAMQPVTSAQVGVTAMTSGTSALGVGMTAVDTLTIAVAAGLATDRFTLTLAGAGEGGIADLAGNRLAGSFIEGGSFPTSGAAGVDFLFRFVVAVGDVDRNGDVRNLDLNAVRNNLFADAGAAGYSVFADLDGDGLTRTADVAVVRDRLFIDVPGAAESGRFARSSRSDRWSLQPALVPCRLVSLSARIFEEARLPRRWRFSRGAVVSLLDALFESC